MLAIAATSTGVHAVLQLAQLVVLVPHDEQVLASLDGINRELGVKRSRVGQISQTFLMEAASADHVLQVSSHLENKKKSPDLVVHLSMFLKPAGKPPKSVRAHHEAGHHGEWFMTRLGEHLPEELVISSDSSLVADSTWTPPSITAAPIASGQLLPSGAEYTQAGTPVPGTLRMFRWSRHSNRFQIRLRHFWLWSGGTIASWEGEKLQCEKYLSALT